MSWLANVGTNELPLWINSYRTLAGKPASHKTKLHMRSFVHRLLGCAIAWGYLPHQQNPVARIKVVGRHKPARPAVQVAPEQVQALLGDRELSPHVAMMVLLALCTGMGASEILRLRWEELNLRRRVFALSEGREVELHPALLERLRAWKMQEQPINGWLFGNLSTGKPFWRDTLQVDHLIPAGLRLEPAVPNLGWNALRSAHRALLLEYETQLAVQAALLTEQGQMRKQA